METETRTNARALILRTLAVHLVALLLLGGTLAGASIHAQLTWHTPPDAHLQVPANTWHTAGE